MLILVPHQRWLGQPENYHHLDIHQKLMVDKKARKPLLFPKRTSSISLSPFWQWGKYNTEPTLKEIDSIAQAKADLKNYSRKLPVGLRKIM